MGRAIAAALAALVLITVVPAEPTRAADDPLRLDVATTYRIDPGKAAVHVILEVTATSLAADTPTQIFFYNAIRFAVQSEARSFKATSGSLDLAVAAEERSGFRAVTITIPDLFYKQSREVRLTFDLPSGKPRSASPIRVGQAHADFVAWAFGGPRRADVRIIVPNRFEADVQTLPAGTPDPITSVAVDGRVQYVADDIRDPTTWYATVNASDRAALTDVPLEFDGERVRIHAWPEDDVWLRRVTRVLEFGLPALETAIGLPWPVTDDLDVSEVTSAEIQGYAGIYDSSDNQIEISEDLDPFVIVHEASHAWFDDELFAERWIAEGLADEYAARIIGARSGASRPAPDAVDPDDKAAFRLNAWPPPSRVDKTTAASESYGYDASWTVMRTIVEEATEARMQEVFKAAASGASPYRGADDGEPSSATPDWRRFLDLVEEIGGSTSASGLIAEWVATPKQRRELETRAEARLDYADLLEAGGTWLPGPVIRRPMTSWQFGDATLAMGAARTVLADRDDLDRAAAALGLAIPADLEITYEAAASSSDLADLDFEIDRWHAATGLLDGAGEALAAERSPLMNLGLFGEDPATGHAAALVAYRVGDLAAVATGAAVTSQLLGTAEEVGRGRAIVIGLLIAALVWLLLVIVTLVSRRRRRERALVLAAPDSGPISGDPYATLAATPDTLEPDAAGSSGAGGAEPD